MTDDVFVLLVGESAALGSLVFDLGVAAETGNHRACVDIIGWLRDKIASLPVPGVDVYQMPAPLGGDWAWAAGDVISDGYATEDEARAAALAHISAFPPAHDPDMPHNVLTGECPPNCPARTSEAARQWVAAAASVPVDTQPTDSEGA